MADEEQQSQILGKAVLIVYFLLKFLKPSQSNNPLLSPRFLGSSLGYNRMTAVCLSAVILPAVAADISLKPCHNKFKHGKRVLHCRGVKERLWQLSVLMIDPTPLAKPI